MDLRIFTEPQQGATYDDLLAVARVAEQQGFDAFFRSDHYLVMGDGDGRPGPDRRLDHPGRHRPGDVDHPPRHPGDGGDVPAARPAGHHRGPGRRHERRTGGARHRRRLVRRGAHRLRDPVPPDGRAVRAPGGGAGHHHRAVVGAGRRRLLLRGRPLPAGGQPGPAQAGPAPRTADHHRGMGPEADPPPGRHLRRRVQPGLRLGRGHGCAVRGGARRLSCGRPRPGHPDPVGGPGGVLWPGRRRDRPPGGGHRTRGRRTAHERTLRPARRDRGRSSAASPGSAPRASTCRSSTSPTSTTWPCWARRCCPR